MIRRRREGKEGEREVERPLRLHFKTLGDTSRHGMTSPMPTTIGITGVRLPEGRACLGEEQPCLVMRAHQSACTSKE